MRTKKELAVKLAQLFGNGPIDEYEKILAEFKRRFKPTARDRRETLLRRRLARKMQDFIRMNSCRPTHISVSARDARSLDRLKLGFLKGGIRQGHQLMGMQVAAVGGPYTFVSFHCNRLKRRKQ